MDISNVMNIFIDYDVIKNSSNESIEDEIGPLITLGRQVRLWDKVASVGEMIAYCKSRGIEDYFFEYMMNDSMNWGKADLVVTNNIKDKERFTRVGIKVNYLTTLDAPNE